MQQIVPKQNLKGGAVTHPRVSGHTDNQTTHGHSHEGEAYQVHISDLIVILKLF